MNFRLTVYDLFAYGIPGGLYLIVAAYLLNSFGVIQLDFVTINSLSTPVAVGLLAASYVTGFVLDPVSQIVHKLFKRGKQSKSSIPKFQSRHPELDVNLKSEDLSTLREAIRLRDPDGSAKLDGLSATRIMLRNVSLGLLLLGLTSLGQQARIGITVLNTVFGVVMLIAFVLASLQSLKYADWHHLLTMEMLHTKTLNLENLIRLRQTDVGESKVETVVEKSEK